MSHWEVQGIYQGFTLVSITLYHVLWWWCDAWPKNTTLLRASPPVYPRVTWCNQPPSWWFDWLLLCNWHGGQLQNKSRHSSGLQWIFIYFEILPKLWTFRPCWLQFWRTNWNPHPDLVHSHIVETFQNVEAMRAKELAAEEKEVVKVIINILDLAHK